MKREKWRSGRKKTDEWGERTEERRWRQEGRFHGGRKNRGCRLKGGGRDDGFSRQQYRERRGKTALCCTTQEADHNGLFACLCGIICPCATLAKLTVKERQIKWDNRGRESVTVRKREKRKVGSPNFTVTVTCCPLLDSKGTVLYVDFFSFSPQGNARLQPLFHH